MSANSYVSSPSSPEHKEMSREEIAQRILELKAELKKKIEKRERGHKINDDEQVRQQVLKKTRENMETQFHTIMEQYNARGFVYAFHSETGNIIAGASDSLTDWWKDELRSYQEGREGTGTGFCSIDFRESDTNDLILPDHSSSGTLESNDMIPAPENCEKEAP